MSELRRVLLSGRTILLLVLTVFLSSMFFMYDCLSSKEITLEGQELTDYIESYPGFLASVQENADTMGTLATLAGGFSAKNIAKTKEDYEKLQNVQPIYGENRGVVLYSEYLTGDLLIMAVVLLTVTFFGEERRKGLNYLVRSTQNGRRLLSLQRTGIVAILSFVTSLLVTLCCMITAGLTCGDLELLRPIQSVPEFVRCPFAISILEYLWASVLLKTLAATLMGLALYLLSALFESVIAILLCGAGFVAEYLLYSLILPTDQLAALKFCNLCALLRTDRFFRQYQNLNFFEHAVGFLSGALALALILLLLLAVSCTLFTSRGGTTRLGSGLWQRVCAWFSKRALPLPLPAWEVKKVFLNQKGLLILVGVVYIATSSALQYEYVLPSYHVYEDVYYQKYGGPITPELVNEMQAEVTGLHQEQAAVEAEITKARENEAPPTLIQALFERLSGIQTILKTLEPLYARAGEGLAYSQTSGIDISLIKPDTYNLLLVGDNATTDKNAIYILLAIIGIFAGICAYENNSNMRPALRSTKRGRLLINAVKLGIIALTCIFVTWAVYRTQLTQIGANGYNDLSAPAQSLELLRFLPMQMSIEGYLRLMFVVRMIGAFAVGAFVMLVSRFCRSSVATASISLAVLVIPVVLASTGVLSIPTVANLVGFRVP